MVISSIFYFHLYLGKLSKVTNIFQRGWNHQLGGLNCKVSMFYVQLFEMGGSSLCVQQAGASTVIFPNK